MIEDQADVNRISPGWNPNFASLSPTVITGEVGSWSVVKKWEDLLNICKVKYIRNLSPTVIISKNLATIRT